MHSAKEDSVTRHGELGNLGHPLTEHFCILFGGVAMIVMSTWFGTGQVEALVLGGRLIGTEAATEVLLRRRKGIRISIVEEVRRIFNVTVGGICSTVV